MACELKNYQLFIYTSEIISDYKKGSEITERDYCSDSLPNAQKKGRPLWGGP
jgi:hypothetical protein